MPQIELTKGQSTQVSEEDFEYLSQWKWRCNDSDYATRTSYKILNEPRHMMYVHREVVERITGVPVPDGYEIDHIDGDKLNNQRENLRLVTRSQNCMNKKGRRGTTSQYKGVALDKRKGKWAAQIMFQGKQNWIGYFVDEEEAARAYDARAKELFGEFARLNFPHEAEENGGDNREG